MMTTKKTANEDRSLDDILKDLRAWSKEAVTVARKAEELEKILVRARGTLEIPLRKRIAALDEGRYRVGDEGPTTELRAAIEDLLARAPRTFQDLMDLTGARRGRVSGVIVALQQEGLVANKGLPTRALWTMIKGKGVRS
jgi:hypothetical protein